MAEALAKTYHETEFDQQDHAVSVPHNLGANSLRLVVTRESLDDSFEFAHFKNFQEREAAFLAIANPRKNHPSINELLSHFKKDQRAKKPGDEVGKYIDSLNQYRLLDPAEVHALYFNMEKGLAVHQEFVNKDRASDLSVEDEKALVEATAAYFVIYNCNLPLVVSVAKKKMGFDDPLITDLLQEGQIGLGEAIRRFDIQKGYQFSTYAHMWIEQRIMRGYIKMARTIRLPDYKSDQWISFKNDLQFLRADLQREPTPDEIADFTGHSIVDIEEMKIFGPRNMTSLNSPLEDSEDSDELIDLIGQYDKRLLPKQEINHGEIDSKITSNIDFSNVPPRQKLFLSLKYRVYFPELANVDFNADELGDKDYGYSFTYNELMHFLHLENGELSDANIATMLGINEASVSESIQRALRTVRDNNVDSELSAAA